MISFYFILIRLINIFIFFSFYIFIGTFLVTYIWQILAYLTIFSVFFFKYFIPIYFILSLYSINYKGYYYLKFFGFDANLIFIFLNKIFFKSKNLIYNYKYLIIWNFFFILFFSFFYEKIYFLIILFFISLYVIFFYLYNNCNKLKQYINYYFLYFNIGLILSIFLILKNENFEASIYNYDYFSDFIYKIASPRWFFKNSYIKLFPEYKKEINHLSEGLCLYNNSLKKNYFSKYTNLELRLDLQLIKERMDQKFINNRSFLNSSNFSLVKYFKNIYLMDNIKPLNKSLLLNYNLFNDKYLFDFKFKPFFSNIHQEIPLKKIVFFGNKDIYVNSYLKNLGLSKNLLINTNLKIKNYASNFNVFYEKENHPFLNNIDNNFNKYLNKDSFTYMDYFYKNYNKNFNIINNKYNTDFLKLKLDLLKYNDLGLLVNDSSNKHNNNNNRYIYNNFLKFYSYIFLNATSNKYNLYNNSIWYKPEIILSDLNENITIEPIINTNLRKFDIEFLISYLNKYYKYFNMDSNLINWLNDFFIIFFDKKKKNYDYWNMGLYSLELIKEKDPFNLYRNLKSSVLYEYKKNLNILTYNEFKKTKKHYEKIRLPNGLKRFILEHNDIKAIFTRYINYNKELERFMNSFFWVSFNESSFVLEKHTTSLNYNNFLYDKGYTILDTFIKTNSNNVAFDNNNLMGFFEIKKKELLDLNKELKLKQKEYSELRTLFKIRRILRFDWHIKNIMCSKNILLKSSLFDLKDLTNFNYILKPFEEYMFIKKILDNKIYDKFFFFYNNELNVMSDSFKIFNNYKNHILLKSFYDYILYNKSLFQPNEGFDYIRLFNNINKNLYMNEDELLYEICSNNIKCYKSILNIMKDILDKTVKDFNPICKGIHIDSEAIRCVLADICRILKEVVTGKPITADVYQKRLLKHLKLTEDYFLQFRPIITHLGLLIGDMTKSIERFNKNNDEYLEKLDKLFIERDTLPFDNTVLFDHFLNQEMNSVILVLEKLNPDVVNLIQEYKDYSSKLDEFIELVDDECVLINSKHMLFQRAWKKADDFNFLGQIYLKKKLIQQSTIEEIAALMVRVDRSMKQVNDRYRNIEKGKETIFEIIDILHEHRNAFCDVFLKDLNNLNKKVKR